MTRYTPTCFRFNEYNDTESDIYDDYAVGWSFCGPLDQSPSQGTHVSLQIPIQRPRSGHVQSQPKVNKRNPPPRMPTIYEESENFPMWNNVVGAVYTYITNICSCLEPNPKTRSTSKSRSRSRSRYTKS